MVIFKGNLLLVSIPVDKVRALKGDALEVVEKETKAGRFQSPWIRFARRMGTAPAVPQHDVSIPVDKVRAPLRGR